MDNTPKRGEIYWVNPSAYRDTLGSVQSPDRPAIIVSNNIGNSRGPILEVVYMTTAPKTDLPTHVTIRSAPQVSTALCEQITTISGEQIGDYIGTCTTAEMMAVEQAMLISLGIDVITLDQNLKKKAMPEPTPEPKEDKIPSDLIIKLAIAQKEADIYKTLYTELLQKSLDK